MKNSLAWTHSNHSASHHSSTLQCSPNREISTTSHSQHHRRLHQLRLHFIDFSTTHFTFSRNSKRRKLSSGKREPISWHNLSPHSAFERLFVASRKIFKYKWDTCFGWKEAISGCRILSRCYRNEKVFGKARAESKRRKTLTRSSMKISKRCTGVKNLRRKAKCAVFLDIGPGQR